MKIMLAVAVAALLSSPALAQEKKPSKEAPAERSSKRLEKMKKKLGLTDEQAGKLEAAHKAHQEAVKPLREQLKKDLEALREKVAAKATDADLKAALDKLKSGRKALRERAEKLAEETEAVLTPSQRAEAALMMAERMERGMGRRHGKGKGGKGQGREERDDADAPEERD
jgi:Spy/CpxP family protein refolding chaperone